MLGHLRDSPVRAIAYGFALVVFARIEGKPSRCRHTATESNPEQNRIQCGTTELPLRSDPSRKVKYGRNFSICDSPADEGEGGLAGTSTRIRVIRLTNPDPSGARQARCINGRAGGWLHSARPPLPASASAGPACSKASRPPATRQAEVRATKISHGGCGCHSGLGRTLRARISIPNLQDGSLGGAVRHSVNSMRRYFVPIGLLRGDT